MRAERKRCGPIENTLPNRHLRMLRLLLSLAAVLLCVKSHNHAVIQHYHEYLSRPVINDDPARRREIWCVSEDHRSVYLCVAYTELNDCCTPL